MSVPVFCRAASIRDNYRDCLNLARGRPYLDLRRTLTEPAPLSTRAEEKRIWSSR